MIVTKKKVDQTDFNSSEDFADVVFDHSYPALSVISNVPVFTNLELNGKSKIFIAEMEMTITGITSFKSGENVKSTIYGMHSEAYEALVKKLSNE